MSEWAEVMNELWCVAYRASQAVEKAAYPHALDLPWWRLSAAEVRRWEAIAEAVKQQVLKES